MPDFPGFRMLVSWSRTFSRSWWFSPFTLACAAVSILLWEFYPQTLWLPLLTGLIPACLRMLSGFAPFERTPLNIPVWLFLFTALLGAWAAYDPQAASLRLRLIVGAVLLFYALASQGTTGLWGSAAFLSIAALLISGYFLLTHDWAAAPEKIGFISRLGRLWMSIRPGLNAPPMYPNTAAGIVAPIVPFVGAITWRAWERKSRLAYLIGIAALLITVSCLILSATRGVWFSYLGAAGLLVLFALSQGAAKLTGWKTEVLLSIFLISILLFGFAYILVSPGGLENLLDSIPGPQMAGSRFELHASLLRLFVDFPLTGGGLGAFPGLYAHYIQVNPNFLVPHGHNLFLDVGLDQGILGLVAVIWIFGTSVWLLIHKRSVVKEKPLWLASLISLTCFIIQGQAADDFYYTPLAFSLLVIPGFVIALTSSQNAAHSATSMLALGESHSQAYRKNFPEQWAGKLLGICGMVLLVLVFFRKPVLASLYSNLGALQLARAELPHWGRSEWMQPGLTPEIARSKPLFLKALRYQPGNRTAHHRLGLIAIYEGDFSKASEHLQIAYQADPGHRGIWKNLGYSLAWSGELEQAEKIISTLPEARQELQAYRWWWRKQGRPDLARNAARLERYLAGEVE